jgi:hypothetical protein
MQEQSVQYIAHLRESIRCGEELVLRAKVLVDNANPADKREWERELERREWQVKYFWDMLQIPEESIQQQ